MGYQDQQLKVEKLEDKQAEFDASLKAYQEQVAVLSAQKEELGTQILTLRESINILTQEAQKLVSDNEALQVKRTKLIDEVDGIFKNKVVEFDQYKKQYDDDLLFKEELLISQQTALAKDRETFEAFKKDQLAAEAALNERESQLIQFEKNLKEREEAVQVQEAKIIQAQKIIESEREELNTKLAVVAINLTDLEAGKDELAAAREQFKADQLKWNETAAEWEKKSKALADVAAEREKLTQDLKEFAEARTKLELREAALTALEQHLKVWEQDLKQQEEVLMEKAKGV